MREGRWRPHVPRSTCMHTCTTHVAQGLQVTVGLVIQQLVQHAVREDVLEGSGGSGRRQACGGGQQQQQCTWPAERWHPGRRRPEAGVHQGPRVWWACECQPLESRWECAQQGLGYHWNLAVMDTVYELECVLASA